MKLTDCAWGGFTTAASVWRVTNDLSAIVHGDDGNAAYDAIAPTRFIVHRNRAWIADRPPGSWLPAAFTIGGMMTFVNRSGRDDMSTFAADAAAVACLVRITSTWVVYDWNSVSWGGAEANQPAAGFILGGHSTIAVHNFSNGVSGTAADAWAAWPAYSLGCQWRWDAFAAPSPAVQLRCNTESVVTSRG